MATVEGRQLSPAQRGPGHGRRGGQGITHCRRARWRRRSGSPCDLRPWHARRCWPERSKEAEGRGGLRRSSSSVVARLSSSSGLQSGRATAPPTAISQSSPSLSPSLQQTLYGPHAQRRRSAPPVAVVGGPAALLNLLGSCDDSGRPVVERAALPSQARLGIVGRWRQEGRRAGKKRSPNGRPRCGDDPCTCRRHRRAAWSAAGAERQSGRGRTCRLQVSVFVSLLTSGSSLAVLVDHADTAHPD